MTFGNVTGPPIISSNLKDTATAKQDYTYTMTATGGPTGFNANFLPDGLEMQVDGDYNPTGVISGKPLRSGVYGINLQFAYNDGSLLGNNDPNASAPDYGSGAAW